MDKNIDIIDLFHMFPFSIFWKNTKGVYLGSNKAMVKWADFPSADFIMGKTDNDMPWKEQKNILHALDNEVISLKNEKSITITMSVSNRRTKCFITESPLYNDHQEIIGIFGIIFDIDHMLNKFNINPLSDLEKIISNMPGTIYWKDRQGKYLGCNDEMLNMLGFKDKSDLLGKNDSELHIDPDTAKKIQIIDNEVMATGAAKINLEEVPFTGTSGHVINQLTNKTPLYDEAKNVIGLVSISIDISELKQGREKLENEKNIAEKKAKNTLENLDRIIAFMPGSVYWKNTDGVYIGCNDAMAKMFSLPKDQILGKTDSHLLGILGLSEDQINTVIKTDKQIMTEGVPILNIEESPFHCPDGRIINQISNKVPVFDENGNVAGILGISIDVSEKKKLEEELRGSRAREERFKAMSALGGMIAHELRNPLIALGMSAVGIEQILPQLINGYEQSVVLGKVPPIRRDRLENLKKSVANMKRSIKYAQTTITTILAGFHYSDINAPIEIAPFSFKKMVETAIAEYPFEIKEENLCIIKHLDGVTVLGAELMVMHVIHNLLKNALHVIQEEKRGEITVWSELQKNKVYLHIEDTAKGIASEQLPHIFDAFYTTKKKSAVSIGLGLYFSKMVLQKMGGDITCDSELDKYTRFTITLPLTKAGV